MDILRVDDQRFKFLTSEHYSFEVTLCKISDNYFISHCEIKRNDSGEYLRNGVSARGSSADDVLRDLYESTKEVICGLGIPSDWNAIPNSRVVLNTHLMYLKKLDDIYDKFEAKVDLKFLNETVRLTSEYVLGVSHRLESMSEDDLIDLVFSNDKNFYILENAEKIDAMIDLYSYIRSPTDAIRKAHLLHLFMAESLIDRSFSIDSKKNG